MPVWSELIRGLALLEQRTGIPAGDLVTPVLYAVLPGLALFLLGARPRELGFARGHCVWRVAALWSAIPLVIIAVDVATGRSVDALVGRTVQTTLHSGPFEEFLFWGALFTRLARLLGDGWGLALSSLAFGLLHVGANATGGDLVTAAAASIVLQGAAPSASRWRCCGPGIC